MVGSTELECFCSAVLEYGFGRGIHILNLRDTKERQILIHKTQIGLDTQNIKNLLTKKTNLSVFMNTGPKYPSSCSENKFSFIPKLYIHGLGEERAIIRIGIE